MRSALERLRHLEPAGLELGHGCLQPAELVAERPEPRVVALVVAGELLVLLRDLRLQLLEPRSIDESSFSAVRRSAPREWRGFAAAVAAPAGCRTCGARLARGIAPRRRRIRLLPAQLEVLVDAAGQVAQVPVEDAYCWSVTRSSR